MNDSTSTEVLQIAPDSIIAMQTLKMEEEGVKESLLTISEFANVLHDPAGHWMKLPYQVLVEDGQVTIIEEVYVPKCGFAFYGHTLIECPE